MMIAHILLILFGLAVLFLPEILAMAVAARGQPKPVADAIPLDRQRLLRIYFAVIILVIAGSVMSNIVAGFLSHTAAFGIILGTIILSLPEIICACRIAIGQHQKCWICK